MSIRNEEGIAPDDFNIPKCSIEDVDRALFTLFDKQLPFIYDHKEGQRRAPVVFATGERFAVLRRKQPLRDRAGALVLPLISIMRTGIDANASLGAGTNQTVEHVIKKRLSDEDPIYQRLLNKMGIENSDDLVSKNAEITSASGSFPGRIATRRSPQPQTLSSRFGKVLNPELGNNIFEIITMPPPKYYTAKYEITFWAQFTTQMNNMLMSLMTLCQSYSQRAFRIETTKGYWFVAYVDGAMSPGNNFDDFTEEERLVRYSFEVTVPAYTIGTAAQGTSNVLRKTLSAPQVSFDMDVYGATQGFVTEPPSNIPSADPNNYILEDIRTVDDSLPGQAMPKGAKSEYGKNGPANVGGAVSDTQNQIIEITVDPFTGKEVKKKVIVKTRINRSGETVLRETIS
jgi:hypothetical protein